METARPLWKRALRRPGLTALRASEMAAGLVYVSGPFQAARAALLARAEAPPEVRAAVFAHVFYPELWDEIVAVRSTLPPGSPIIATAPPPQADALRAKAAGDPGVTILERPNRGRDIAPFLEALDLGLLDPFDAVLKIHTKKSPHLRQGSLRRRVFYAALAGSRGVAARALAQFREPDVGLVGPGAYFRRAPFYWMGNRERVAELSMRMGADAELGFFEGSMFWVRPAALAPLRGLRLRREDFEDERGQLDGALHHAVERLFTIAAAAAGYETRSIGARTLMAAAGPRRS
jgi:lipopolysaccharide biosynthesis protein